MTLFLNYLNTKTRVAWCLASFLVCNLNSSFTYSNYYINKLLTYVIQKFTSITYFWCCCNSHRENLTFLSSVHILIKVINSIKVIKILLNHSLLSSMEFIDLKHLGAGVVNIVNAGPTNCDTNGSENILLIISKLFLIHN